MKIYETQDVPASTREVLVCRSCDLCGQKSKRQGKINWDVDSFWDINETEVSIKIRQRDGETYPEGGSGTEYEIDLCPDCFKNRFVVWLKNEGAKIEEKDWDW